MQKGLIEEVKKKPDGKVIVERASSMEIRVAYGITGLVALGAGLTLITKDPEYFGDAMAIFMFVGPFCLFVHALGNLVGREVGVYSHRCIYIRQEDGTYTKHAFKDIGDVTVTGATALITLTDGQVVSTTFKGHPQAVNFKISLIKHVPKKRKGVSNHE